MLGSILVLAVSVLPQIYFVSDANAGIKACKQPDGSIVYQDSHCDLYSRKFENGLPLAIADALYLDGSWHRFEMKQTQLEQAAGDPPKLVTIQKEINEAACNILMSQKILRAYGQDTIVELRKKKRRGEDLGLDDPDECDAGDEEVCEYVEAISIYQRMQSDIRALRTTNRHDSGLDSLFDDLAESTK